jgi:hypothetical protein
MIRPKGKSLRIEQIAQSSQIQDWLAQFASGRDVAIELLMRLRFIGRDVYAEWLKTKLTSVVDGAAAVYVVRRLPPSVRSLWNSDGECSVRPPESAGSEDLVFSIVANLLKDPESTIVDHPSLEVLRETRIRQIILLDDSIGSGKRVADFIRRMTSHSSFLSWWSYGKIHLTVIAYSRMVEADETIIESLPGSERGLRTHPKSSKIRIVSNELHRKSFLQKRWGASAQLIKSLCLGETRIPSNRRLGYGDSMANVVFYHSVPNNIPGVLWFQNDDWNALFPARSLPAWVTSLLEAEAPRNLRVDGAPHVEIPDSATDLLRLVKRGIRKEITLAWRVGLDRGVVQGLMLQMRSRGLVNSSNRITQAGHSFLMARQHLPRNIDVDYNLYVPSKWCAGRETAQPSGLRFANAQLRTESETGAPVSDGEVGETSLERSDVKTALPSINVVAQHPSRSREGHDVSGPEGLKET